MPDAVTTEAKVEELKQDTEVQKALDQTAPPKEALSPRANDATSFFSPLMLLFSFFQAPGIT